MITYGLFSTLSDLTNVHSAGELMGNYGGISGCMVGEYDALRKRFSLLQGHY